MSINFLIRVITKAFTFILFSTLLTLLMVTVHASDALSLDTSFSADGMVTTFFSPGNDVGSGIAVQSDGKIVVVGTSDDGSGTSEFAVARFNVDGSLDTSFNGDGMVTAGFLAGNDVGSGIAVQFDDKIVVVGTSNNGSGTSDFAVACYPLDLSFSGFGAGGLDGGGGGSGCFVATAAYGSPMSPDLKESGKFHDLFLFVNTVGKGFVRLYKSYSLLIANLDRFYRSAEN